MEKRINLNIERYRESCSIPFDQWVLVQLKDTCARLVPPLIDMLAEEGALNYDISHTDDESSEILFAVEFSIEKHKWDHRVVAEVILAQA